MGHVVGLRPGTPGKKLIRDKPWKRRVEKEAVRIKGLKEGRTAQAMERR